ncbi:uncharacterized protein SS50377_28760 [Spironucleus salmonicida]|uniref:Uncharacterized protein n=1 Tax=Spironucleus salmonicida TaxID=348837 RepID=A0A9P8LJP7_9EUKA|nr:hypothetical protein SS50377_28760 [Spironucleus salmonicida]
MESRERESEVCTEGNLLGTKLHELHEIQRFGSEEGQQKCGYQVVAAGLGRIVMGIGAGIWIAKWILKRRKGVVYGNGGILTRVGDRQSEGEQWVEFRVWGIRLGGIREVVMGKGLPGNLNFPVLRISLNGVAGRKIEEYGKDITRNGVIWAVKMLVQQNFSLIAVIAVRSKNAIAVESTQVIQKLTKVLQERQQGSSSMQHQNTYGTQEYLAFIGISLRLICDLGYYGNTG